MGLADIVRQIERENNRRGIVSRRKKGWLPRLYPYTGYGSTSAVRVMARALMANPNATDWQMAFAQQAKRGWRQFFTTQVGYLPVTVTVNGRDVETFTSESGYIDLLIEDHGLEPGRHCATITPAAGDPVQAPVIVVDPGVSRGIISDVDDTIMITWLPRPMLALWNSFVLHTNARKAVPGISEFYKAIIEPGSPVFYLSTGAWNTAPTLSQFILEHGLPDGPLLLTDWGPTPTGLFRSGKEHKMTQLRNLLIMFPHIKWILVGDDGQHDPEIYAEFARECPHQVAGIAIRSLSEFEQFMSHGTFDAMVPDALWTVPEQIPVWYGSDRHVPTVYGRDGYELLARWQAGM